MEVFDDPGPVEKGDFLLFSQKIPKFKDFDDSGPIEKIIILLFSQIFIFFIQMCIFMFLLS